MKKITLVLIILFLVFFFSSVDILGMAFQPAGSFYYRPDTDINVYFTYLDQARAGRFWFCNQFAVENGPCKLFFPLWYAGGQLGSLFNLSNLAIIIIARVLLLAVFFYLLWLFIKKIFPDKTLGSWLLIIFSGGLYLYYLHGNFFISALQNPLNIFIAILLLLLLWLSVNLWEKFSFSKALWLAPLSFFIILTHPYEAFVLIINYGLLILLSALFIPKKIKQAVLVFILVSLGVVLAGLYYFKVFTAMPAYQGWLLDNYLPFKGFSSILINTGLFLPLAFFGFWLLFKNKKDLDTWLVISSWFVGGLTAVILPLYVNIKFLLPWYFGLALLALLGFWRLTETLTKKYKTIVIVFLAGLLLSGNFYFYFNEVNGLLSQQPPRYLPTSYIEPLNWLKQNASITNVILASPAWDTFVSGYSGLRSLVGSNQVYQQDYKRSLVFWFFKNNNEDDFKIKFLKEYNIDYIYYSLRERELGNFMPAEKKYLKQVYENSWAKIYKVVY